MQPGKPPFLSSLFSTPSNNIPAAAGKEKPAPGKATVVYFFDRGFRGTGFGFLAR
jgi:hypothetical protein